MDKFLHLICHPDTPVHQIRSVEVAIGYAEGKWALAFTVLGEGLLMPRRALPTRTDGLWQSTCFEMFVAGEREGYTEFNFCPSTQWAAYRFEGYRKGMADIDLTAPHIEPIESGIRVGFDFLVSATVPIRLGLSAIIEEQGGTKSYWALAHPPGKPNFHHPDCFALQLPAGTQG